VKQLLQLESFLPYRFDRLAKHVSVSLAGVYRQRFNITVPQWRALALLHERPGASAKQIAQHGNLDKVMVSRVVVNLETRGLLRRSPKAADARSNELHLTPRGVQLFEKIAPLALGWEADLLSVLSKDERRSFENILCKLEAQASRSAHASQGAPVKTQIPMGGVKS